MRRSGLSLDPQPWPVYMVWEGGIGFVGGMKSKSETKMDRHSRNSEDGKVIDSDLLLPQITKDLKKIRRFYQRSAYLVYFGLKGVWAPTRPKSIARRVDVGPLLTLCPRRKEIARLNINSTDFLINRKTMGKKPVAFLVGIQWSKQGEGVHIF